jgi:hypothetical protein
VKKYLGAAAAAHALLALLALLAPVAQAGEALVSWQNATTDTTGVALPATGPDALAETRVAIGSCSSAGVFGTQIGSVSTVPAPVLSILFQNLADGVYCFRARHATNAGVLSDWSAVVSKTIITAPKKPRPPVNVAAT